MYNSKFIHMASNYFLVSAVLIFTFLQSQAQGGYVEFLDPKRLGLKKEKLTYFHFYMHATTAGPSPTSLTLITPANNTMVPGAGTTNAIDGVFGTVNIIDNPLTEGPESSSKLIGKVQGVSAQASQEETSLLMVINFVFLTDKYNGSSIAVLGRNEVYNEGKEMPIVGGSGRFRFARGYTVVTTYSFNETANGVISEFKVYALQQTHALLSYLRVLGFCCKLTSLRTHTLRFISVWKQSVENSP